MKIAATLQSVGRPCVGTPKLGGYTGPPLRLRAVFSFGHRHSQWRAAGSLKLGGELGFPALTENLTRAMADRPVLWTDPTNWMRRPVALGPPLSISLCSRRHHGPQRGTGQRVRRRTIKMIAKINEKIQPQ